VRDGVRAEMVGNEPLPPDAAVMVKEAVASVSSTTLFSPRIWTLTVELPMSCSDVFQERAFLAVQPERSRHWEPVPGPCKRNLYSSPSAGEATAVKTISVPAGWGLATEG